MALDTGFPGDYQMLPPVTFIAANGTAGKIAIDKQLAAGVNTQGLPTNANLLGGCRLLDLCASSTDGSGKDVIRYQGMETSLYANMGTVATTATGNATITRSTGSFVTDGYKIGDTIMVFGSVANDGILGTITTVAALTLTLNGVPAGWTANAEAAGFRIIRVGAGIRVTVAANSGVGATATSNVTLLNSGVDAAVDRSGLWVGANNIVILAMQAAVSALPAYITMTPVIARY